MGDPEKRSFMDVFNVNVHADTLRWLLSGDVAIAYQAKRDLIGQDLPGLQNRIVHEGWGKMLLENRNPSGHWGTGFYSPKWISSHYSLLELRELCAPHDLQAARETIQLILEREKSADGGVNPASTIAQSDVCVNGMFLNYAAWFGTGEESLQSIVDFIISQQCGDGGFNCRFNRSGCRHSSLHSTLSVAEGIAVYEQAGYHYKLKELMAIRQQCDEFILIHRLFLSDRTGEVIQPQFLRFPWPARWKYDIMRALDYFRSSGRPFDERMQPALEQIMMRRKSDGTWHQATGHPGKVHFDYEPAGKPGRWNTLRALRVIRHFMNGLHQQDNHQAL